MPISVRFALRSPKKGEEYSNPHTLEVWITVNSKRAHFAAVWPIQTGTALRVNPKEWHVKKQAVSRRDAPVNQKITALKAHIESIFERQCVTAPATIKSVVYELTVQRPPVWQGEYWLLSEIQGKSGVITEESSLLEAYRLFVIEEKLKRGGSKLRADRAHVTRWERGLFLLEEWQQKTGKPVPACYRISLSWLRDFHAWMVGQPSGKQKHPISSPQASRYIGKIGKILQWLVDDDLLTHNSVKKTSWPRYNDKEILFLEPEHVRHLFDLNWKGVQGIALWWFLLMCCTGLDYPDAKAYVADRGSLERLGSAGWKLVGRRMKSPHELYDVPLLSEVRELFARFPSGPRVVSSKCINSYTEDIEAELGIEWRITSKTARKTYGCLMIVSGYMVAEVSRMLGHKRISTTEGHYIRFIPSGVDRARLRVGKDSIL